MAIYVYPADPYACGHFRLIWPGLALAATGMDVKVIAPGSREGIAGDIDKRSPCPKCAAPTVPHNQVPDGNLQVFLYACNGAGTHPPVQWRGTGTIIDLRVPADAEAVVLQRLTLSHMADGVKLLRERRPDIAIIVDMDDDLRSINPDNPAFWAMHKKWGYAAHSAENAMRGCLNATLVTVSTPALLRVYAPHGRGQVLYNRVPRGYLDIPHEDGTTMSWPGSVHSHPHDLQQVGPAISRLIREGHQYVATGSAVGVKAALNLDVDPDSTGDVDFEQWPWAVSRIGVGIAPLADTVFNRGKSWLKPLEMSAAGVPWVASPRAEYARLHRDHQVGLMAKDPRDWYKQLRRLLTNQALRLEQSHASRAAAAANTVEAHAWQWAEAWQGAIEVARRSAPALRLG